MSYKVFQNGFPLPASDLNNFLMNQSVMAFANAAARSSAIASPIEGMLSYLEDTNTYEGYNGSAWVNINDNGDAIPKSILDAQGDLIVASGADTPSRLALGGSGALLKSNGTTATWQAIGASGRVLTSTGTDVTWAESGGSSITQIATTSLSGAAVNFSSITGIYKNLLLVVEGMRAAVSTNGFNLSFNGLGTNHIQRQRSTDGAAAQTFTSAVTAGESSGNITTQEGRIQIEIFDYSATSGWKVGTIFNARNDSTTATSVRMGMHILATNITGAITRIDLGAPGGGTFAAGTATLFGVK